VLDGRADHYGRGGVMPAPITSQRAKVIRDRMREEWGERARQYATLASARNRAFAERLVAAVRPQPGERVLDVATGPGAAALVAAKLVGPAGRVLATDLAPEFGEIVAAESAAAGVDNVEFRVMGAEGLALPDASFDVVLCQFGLMFVPDPVRALSEMRRVLRPRGRLGVAVWSSPEKVDHFLASRILTRLAPPLPEGERMPTPLELSEPGLIDRHVAAADFREIAVTRFAHEFVVAEPEEEWRRLLNEPAGPIPRALGLLSAAAIAEAHDQVIAAFESRRRADGEIWLSSEAVIVTATP
jgi:ubiquinone/menaquinone biosynthesis C-methylase UbiE